MAKRLPDPEYTPDESHRQKHRWDNAYAEILEGEDGAHGKCSSSASDVAQELLDDGVPFSGKARKQLPTEIYNVFEGVPYCAHPYGKSPRYRGFPEIWGRIPKSVRPELERRAAREGATEALEDWKQKTRKFT